MDFTLSDRQRHWRDRVIAFMDAHVYPNEEKEIEFFPVLWTEAAVQWTAATMHGTGSMLRDLETLPVFHWHGETFDLPDGAVLLASTKACRNQAFRIGPHAYAFQFHFEATRPMLRSWVKAADIAALAKTHPDFLPGLEGDIARHMPGQAALARQISERWLDLVEASAAPRRLQKAG